MKHPGYKARVVLDQGYQNHLLLGTHLSGGPSTTEKVFSPFLSYDMNDPTFDVALLTIELDCRFLRWITSNPLKTSNEP